MGTEISMQLTTSAKERKIGFVVRAEWVNSQAEAPFKRNSSVNVNMQTCALILTCIIFYSFEREKFHVGFVKSLSIHGAA